MKKFLLFFGFWAALVAYSCQKDSNFASLNASNDYTETTDDRGGKGKHGHHPKDSTKKDSIKHHHDTLKHHHDTIKHGGGKHHHDSIKIHHPHDSTACKVAPKKINLQDLPQAAQDWIAANKAGVEVKEVLKITKKDCSVYYQVRFKGSQAVRFDAEGKKL